MLNNYSQKANAMIKNFPVKYYLFAFSLQLKATLTMTVAYFATTEFVYRSPQLKIKGNLILRPSLSLLNYL